MKDEFDDVTLDMFERGPDKKVSKSTGETTVEDKTYGEKAARSPSSKAPARPFTRGTGGAGGAGGETGFGIQKMNKNLNRTYKKGGTVSSASKRADGCVTKGRTKGRFV